MDWDDHQRYRSVENTDDGTYDPETAKIIRSTIESSNKQKLIYHSQQTQMLHSVSAATGSFNNSFREIIKKKSMPQLETLEYAQILTQYNIIWMIIIYVNLMMMIINI